MFWQLAIYPMGVYTLNCRRHEEDCFELVENAFFN